MRTHAARTDPHPNPERLSRGPVIVSRLDDPSDDRLHWWRQSPEARMAALEMMRQVVFGYDPPAGRLQRLLEITQRASR